MRATSLTIAIMVLSGFVSAARAEKVPVPADVGLYLGSGVYGAPGKLHGGGFCSTYWMADRPQPEDVVDLCAAEEIGNTLQFWQKNEKLVALAEKAKAKGLYTTCMYSSATNGMARKMVDSLGPLYLGHDFGEIFSFSLYENFDGRGDSLKARADEYMGRVRRHVDKLHGEGWGRVMATSAAFTLDYEVAAGVEIPCTEDYPFGDLMLASALDRGLYRQYDLPMWGSHLAHEWYSWIPHSNPYKLRSLETALYLKYMAGAKLIINESGNWQQQSFLCEDSPMTKMPVPFRDCHQKVTPEVYEKYVKPVEAEARKRYAYIDDRSPVTRKYQRIMKDFYAFCKRHPAPKGQPEVTWALAKGHLDLGSARCIPGSAVCAAYDLADKNPNWMHGDPERSWETVREALMPQPPMLKPNKNIHYSSTPYGMCDIVSFADNTVSAAYLLGNYKSLIFSGWNTCTPKQYRTLCDYVKGGGKLVIGLCHLSTRDDRKYNALKPQDLINGGDLTELCGLKVTNVTQRMYWATGYDAKKNCLGFSARRRFGYMCLPLGELAFAGPEEDFEKLAVEAESGKWAYIVRCRKGKGEVYLMNWWSYPSTANMDVGIGSEYEHVGLVGYLYKYVAKVSRGNVWITGPDFENPDEDCKWIVYSYFPDAGQICLLNLDYEHERKFVLQQFGDKEFVTLKPGEFRIVDSVKLDPDEKLNVEL